jgi:nicotinamidase-related amidase
VSLSLDPRSSALVIIDLQQGIVAHQLTPHDARTVIDNSERIAKALRAAGGTVVAVHVGFSADAADRLSQPVDAPTQLPAGELPSNWSDLVPEIAALDAQVVIKKRQWSAFHGTELDLQLRRRGIRTMIITGIATNFGVEGTARDAWSASYDVVVAEDACSGNGPDMHRFAIERILPRISRIRKTAEIIEAIERSA